MEFKNILVLVINFFEFVFKFEFSFFMVYHEF